MGLGIIGGSVGVAAGSVALHITGAYHVSVLIVVGVCVFGAVVSAFAKRPKFDGKVFE
ncbi:MAG: hypothetical protein LBN36_05350 [Clostridiales Family XIII bacterium]|nr:hypothetical protein [Clostridiales Family XIII bacterium]